MDRRKYRSIMTSLCAGLIAAVFFYIRTELRLNGAIETVSEAICMEKLQGPDRTVAEESLYTAVGKDMGEKSCAAAQAAYIPEGKEN